MYKIGLFHLSTQKHPSKEISYFFPLPLFVRRLIVSALQSHSDVLWSSPNFPSLLPSNTLLLPILLNSHICSPHFPPFYGTCNINGEYKMQSKKTSPLNHMYSTVTMHVDHHSCMLLFLLGFWFF